MSGPEPFPLTRSMRAYLDAFTRSVLASKSTASDEERAAADDGRARALDSMLLARGVTRGGQCRGQDRHPGMRRIRRAA